MSGCIFLKDIYGWVWLFKRLLWVGVTVYSTSMSERDCLEHFYRWMWVVESGCGWVWVGMTGCGWVSKMLKPIMNCLMKRAALPKSRTRSYMSHLKSKIKRPVFGKSSTKLKRTESCIICYLDSCLSVSATFLPKIQSHHFQNNIKNISILKLLKWNQRRISNSICF